jgi:hypothetical protein
MEKLTPLKIKKYLLSNYGKIEHNCYGLVYASRKLAKNQPFSPSDVFFFIIERKNINSFPGFTSYGFDTAAGRNFRSQFELYYNEEVNKQLDAYDLPF